MFKKSRNTALYPERTEFQEFGKAAKEYRRCRICSAIYYDKSWHHGRDFDLAAAVKNHKFWITRCPACSMIEEREFEGELIIRNIPARFQMELYRLIRGYGRRAYELDCQHRIIAIAKEDKHTWRVTTTENQLAGKLAKKIREVFDRVEIATSYSEAPEDVERIVLNFQPFYTFIKF